MSSKITRSVDSLQKIYAVIIALAINETIKSVLAPLDSLSNNLSSISLDSIMLIVSFFVLVVPFYHGMNRHLDICYIEAEKKPTNGALLFDFAIFCAESSLLFLFVKFMHRDLYGYLVLGIILLVDMLWGIISHFIHYQKMDKSVIRWTFINITTIIIGIFIFSASCLENKNLLFMVLSIVRTIADYAFCWKFYFPPIAGNSTTETDKIPAA